MKRLVLILISCVAGCAGSRAVNPYPVGTHEYQQWQDDRNLQKARHNYVFEGHELPSPSTPTQLQQREPRR